MGRGAPVKIPIKCVETGEIFPTIKAAGEAIGSQYKYLRQGLACGQAVKGFHFVYVDDQRAGCFSDREKD
eukprot:g43224.t1